jgi:SAM-dependent methyltransferase
VKCPLCASETTDIFARWPDYSVLQCRSCGFRFIDTDAPDYPQSAQYFYDESSIGQTRPDQPHIQRRVRDVLRFAKPPGRALDIGCGKGEVALALRYKGFDCMGIDMKPRVIEHLQAAHPEVVWRCAMTSDLAGLDEKFDVITMYHVLEHIPDPKAALATVKALAKPGALIVIEVPNVGGREAWLSGPRWHYYKVDHVNYFRLGDLLSLAGNLDLKVLGVRGYQHFSYPQDVLWKDFIKGALALIGFKDVISVFLRVN